MKKNIDVIAVGEIVVDLYAEQTETQLKYAQSFRKNLGGYAARIAVGASRLNLCSSLISSLGKDVMGDFLIDVLRRENVDTERLEQNQSFSTAVVVHGGVFQDQSFPLMSREICADMNLKADNADVKYIQSSKSLVITGTGLSTDLMRKATHHVVDLAKESDVKVVFDLEYQPAFWKGKTHHSIGVKEMVTEHYQGVLAKCDLVVGTEEEFCIASGAETCSKALEILQERTAAILVVKMGREGCLVVSNDDGQKKVQGFPMKRHNRLGAGESFLSGFLRGWINGECLERCALWGNACGAIAVTRDGRVASMPNFDEMMYFIENYAVDHSVCTSRQFHNKHRFWHNAVGCKSLILAIDHSQYIEDMCNQNDIHPSFIGQFKEKVFEGFLSTQQHLRHSDLGVLIDHKYAQRVIVQCENQRLQYGIPVETASDLPIKWADQSGCYQQLLKRSPLPIINPRQYGD